MIFAFKDSRLRKRKSCRECSMNDMMFIHAVLCFCAQGQRFFMRWSI